MVNGCDADRKWEEKNNQQNVQMYIAQSQRLYILVMLCIQTMHNNPFNVYACILIIVIVLKTFGVFQKKSQQMKHETRRKKKRTPTAYVYYIKSVAFYVQKEILYIMWRSAKVVLMPMLVDQSQFHLKVWDHHLFFRIYTLCLYTPRKQRTDICSTQKQRRKKTTPQNKKNVFQSMCVCANFSQSLSRLMLVNIMTSLLFWNISHMREFCIQP